MEKLLKHLWINAEARYALYNEVVAGEGPSLVEAQDLNLAGKRYPENKTSCNYL